MRKENECIRCGWCCREEVCPVGLDFGASEKIPCEYLVHICDMPLYGCKLMLNGDAEMGKRLGIGIGCPVGNQIMRGDVRGKMPLAFNTSR
jgi:hypothetical protein